MERYSVTMAFPKEDVDRFDSIGPTIELIESAMKRWLFFEL
jgi:hypothetical protein